MGLQVAVRRPPPQTPQAPGASASRPNRHLPRAAAATRRRPNRGRAGDELVSRGAALYDRAPPMKHALDAPERPVDQEALDRTLAAHRAAMAHKLGQVRIVGVASVLVLSLVLWKGLDLPDWGPNVLVFGAYLPVAIGIYVAGLRWPRFAQVSGNAVALGDVPVIWGLQALAMPLAPSPGGMAGFALGIFVFLVLLAALSLSTRQVLLVAALST